MSRLLLLVLVVTTAGAFRTEAADQCRDVLVNAVFDTKKVTWDNYVSISILSDLSSFSDQAKSHSLDLTVPIYGVPVNLGWKDASRVRTKYEQHYDFEAVKKETGSLLLMTGQQAIID